MSFESLKSASILICTRNGGDRIHLPLESLQRLILPENLDLCEILVVDNGSTDDTGAVVKHYQDAASHIILRAVEEPRPGKTVALNTGVAACRGELILMTDDDAEVDRHWLLAYYDAACRHPEAGYFFGKIRVNLPFRPPEWWNHLTPRSLSGRDQGDMELRFDHPDDWEGDIVGVNMAGFSRILRTFRFDPRLGVSPLTGFDGTGDTELGRRLRRHGYPAYYVPDAWVVHHIPPKRLSTRYLLRRKFRIGRPTAYLERGLVPSERLPSMFPVFRRLLRAWWGYLGSLCKKDSVEKYHYAFMVSKLLGQLTEHAIFQYTNRKLYAHLARL